MKEKWVDFQSAFSQLKNKLPQQDKFAERNIVFHYYLNLKIHKGIHNDYVFHVVQQLSVRVVGGIVDIYPH